MRMLSELLAAIGREGIAPQAGAALFVNGLHDLNVDLFLGIHPGEQADGQRVLVSTEILCAYPEGVRTDDIAEVIDYDFLRPAILALAGTERFQLQEIFCERIAALCWRSPYVLAARVRSNKPDIYPDASIGCEIVRVNPALLADRSRGSHEQE